MEKITGNEPAMPTGFSQSGTGLSIRQEFAARFMASFLLNSLSPDRILKEANRSMLKEVSEASVLAADYLIAELNKPQP